MFDSQEHFCILFVYPIRIQILLLRSYRFFLMPQALIFCSQLTQKTLQKFSQLTQKYSMKFCIGRKIGQLRINPAQLTDFAASTKFHGIFLSELTECSQNVLSQLTTKNKCLWYKYLSIVFLSKYNGLNDYILDSEQNFRHQNTVSHSVKCPYLRVFIQI